jgi:hypothetical protein
MSHTGSQKTTALTARMSDAIFTHHVMNNLNYGEIEDKFFRIRKLLWWVLIGCLGVYAVLGFFLQARMGLEAALSPTESPGLYAAVKLGLLALSAGHLWLGGYLCKKNGGRLSTKPAEPFKLSPGQLSGLTEEQRAQVTALQKQFAGEITAWGLMEAIGIYGFVVFFLFGAIEDLLLFIGIAGIGFYYSRPDHRSS